MAFALSSPAFPSGGKIPRKYTLEGDNLSPPLEWHDPPKGTKSFALVVEDPDAPNGTFRHWAIYNIAAGSDRLPEDAGHGAARGGLGMGVNDFGHPRYDGPRPPKGDPPHHYHFKLAALDVERLPEPAHASVEDIWRKAKAHSLGETETVGVYQRP